MLYCRFDRKVCIKFYTGNFSLQGQGQEDRYMLDIAQSNARFRFFYCSATCVFGLTWSDRVQEQDCTVSAKYVMKIGFIKQ